MKHGLSRKIPQTVLCSRKNAHGVGIMIPITRLDVLKAKTCLRKIWKKG